MPLCDQATSPAKRAPLSSRAALRSLTRMWLGFGVTLLIAKASHAEEYRPFTLNQPSGEAHLSLGAYTGDGRVNPYGFGLGLRGGTTLPNSVYLGGLIEYYFGGSYEGSNGFFDDVSASSNLWLIQAEPGYDFALSPAIVVRPHLNAGFAYVGREDCIAGACDSGTDAYVSIGPAGTLLVRLEKFVLAFSMRFNGVATASDRSSAGGFLFSAGVATPLEKLGIRFGQASDTSQTASRD